MPANLNDPQLILKGAGQYAAMCTSCHLAPGVKDSELRPGLYPLPPNLSQVSVDPREAFWVIKHGMKMSAMPAWGASHDDATIWSMVASSSITRILATTLIRSQEPAGGKARLRERPCLENAPAGGTSFTPEWHLHNFGAAPE